MKTKLIKDFENDYLITSNGDIIDLTTNKKKIVYYRGSDKRPIVDLYKNGENLLSLLVIEVIIYHFFEKFKDSHYNIIYLDNDRTNCCVNNIRLVSKS